MRLSCALGLACALAVPVLAQPTPPAQPGKAQPAPTVTYPTPLYRMNDVGKALNLTQDQITKLNTLTDQTQTKFRDDYAKIGTLNEADRFARTQELNRLYSAEWNKNARNVFNDTQTARYQQLYYQYGGFDTFYDPDVQKRLNLTDDQIKNLRAQHDWSTQQLQDIYRVGTTDATKGTRMYRDYWTARQERLDKFLTPEQRKTWNQMIGDPYTFAPTFTPPR